MSRLVDKQWAEVDPKVQWAIDLLEKPEGYEPNDLFGYYTAPLIGTLIGLSTNLFRNRQERLPLRAGLPITVALTAAGFYFGTYVRDRNIKKTADKLDVARHYIMTHPELFPEPERKKYGDKNVLYAWEPTR